MSAARVLPMLQARADFVPVLARLDAAAEPALPPPPAPPPPQLAFYRKYTEAILRRYVRMSMEVGRVPSLLGRELFRGKITSYRVESFEDAVIFCHDVERSIARLSHSQQALVERIALKQYSVVEAADILATDRRTILRRYCQAIDHLTRIFLDVQLLRLQKSCQAPKTAEKEPTNCNHER